jgi:hypothetical protein
MNLVYKRFCEFRAACGDPRDHSPLPAGGPLSAVSCGIGPSSSKSATNQTATNQQVAVSGGGTAVGARTANISKTGVGSATQVESPGATSIVVGAKGSLSVSNQTSNQTNSNNRTSNVSTINNSGTNTTNYTYGDDALATAALNAVTNQGSQFGDAIQSLADTVTHAISSLITPAASPAAAPVVYVTSPASPALTTDAGSISPATVGNTGLTKGEIYTILAAVVVIGAAMVWHANK